MSAWIVSKKHIDALVTWAVNYELVVVYKGNALHVSDNPSEVGKALWRENFRSVNYRYQEHKRTPKYTFEKVTERELKDGIVIFKNLGCYDYQTCERPDYDKSYAKAFVDSAFELLAILGYTYSKLKNTIEYENAPWGIY